jgi:hypothetical protein
MRFLLVAGLTIACAGPAVAGTPVPDPSKCTIPSFILLVGSNGSTADPIGAFNITVMDFSDHPIANSAVTIRFSACTYAGVCLYQPGVITDCPNKEVMTTTGVSGVGSLILIGGASLDECPSDSPGCASIYADGFFLGYANVAALELDGSNGLTGGDLAVWLGGYFCGSTSPRLDYNGDGLITGGDLSLWLGAFFGGHSALGCPGTLCQ